MSESSSEPTMEEILASIRRIISEDEQPAEAAAPVEGDPEPEPPPPPPLPIPDDDEPEPAPPPAPIPIPDDEPEDDALELTQKVETHGDLDVMAPVEPEPFEDVGEPPPPVAGHEPYWPNKPAGKLVSEPTEELAASAFGRLSASILMPAYGRTLEDVVRELLSPLLKQWLDDNLPRIVQTAVDEEVARIARGGRPPGG